MAGIIAAIVSISLASIFIESGLQHWAIPPPPIPSMMNIATIIFTINIVWGIVLGIIYAQFYDLIPGKQVFKGIFYGLFLWLTHHVHIAFFAISYAPDYVVADFIAIVIWIVYGLILAIFFDFLYSKYCPSRRQLQIIRPDLRKGIHPGAIAALIGSIAIFIAEVLLWNPIDFPQYMTDVSFLISQFGTHAFINMVWGIGWGVLYVMFYDRIPGNRISKGIIFSMILYFILDIRWAIIWLYYGFINWFISFGNGIFFHLVYGLLIGILYRKE